MAAAPDPIAAALFYSQPILMSLGNSGTCITHGSREHPPSRDRPPCCDTTERCFDDGSRACFLAKTR